MSAGMKVAVGKRWKNGNELYKQKLNGYALTVRIGWVWVKVFRRAIEEIEVLAQRHAFRSRRIRITIHLSRQELVVIAWRFLCHRQMPVTMPRRPQILVIR